MPDNLNGKVAVVTGSGQGIGKAIALALAHEGAAVVTNNRKKGSTGLTTYDASFAETMNAEQKTLAEKLSGDAETTADEIRKMGCKAVPFYGDVGDFETAGKLIKTAVDHFGKIDILVNNAGTFRHAWPWEMTEAEWDHVTGNKPKSAFNMIRHALPFMMKQKWGRIINCTSGAWLGQKHHANYSAANAGVVGLTRSVARDVFDYGITCNAFAPGAMTRSVISLRILADRWDKTGTPLTAESFAKAPTSEQLAPFIAYLATEAAANISGTVFSVRGNHIERFSEPEKIAALGKKDGLWTVDELIDQVPDALLTGYQALYQPGRRT